MGFQTLLTQRSTAGRRCETFSRDHNSKAMDFGHTAQPPKAPVSQPGPLAFRWSPHHPPAIAMEGPMKALLKTLGGVAALLVLSSPAAAAPVSYNVGVCDPAYTARCIKPDENGALSVGPGGMAVASTGNTTTAPLAGAATFTGTWQQSNYPDVLVSMKTDVAGTLTLDFSNDGTNADSSLSFTVDAGANEFQPLLKGPRYFRVRYTNGSAAQSYLRLYTYFGTFRQPSSPLNATVQDDAPSNIARTISDETLIAEGKYQGRSIVNKFGRNPDIDQGAILEDIWDGGGTYTGWATAPETVTVVSTSTADASAGTGARTIRVTGLDANYNIQSETITLNGTTPAAGLLSFIRVHTAQILTAGSGGVNAGAVTIRQTTTSANIFSVMQIGLNQTNSSAYTIPAGYTGYLRQMAGNIRGVAAADVTGYVWTRSFGGVFRARRPFVISTSIKLDDYIYGGLVFTEKSDLILRSASGSTNNLDVTGGYDMIIVRNTN